jgi:hypothetical protein
MRRIIAYVLKFIYSKLSEKHKNRFLFGRDEVGQLKFLTAAEIVLIRKTQHDYPPEKAERTALNLFVDEQKLIRCRGRMSNSDCHMKRNFHSFSLVSATLLNF